MSNRVFDVPDLLHGLPGTGGGAAPCITAVVSLQTRQGFWREALALQGSITPKVVPLVAAFGLIASVVCFSSAPPFLPK